jgi:hypothetical protein
MKAPYFRPNLDLGRCGLGHVLMIDWMHKLAALATKKKAVSSPGTWEVLAAAITHTGFPLLDALSWMRKRIHSFYRTPGTNLGRQ